MFMAGRGKGYGVARKPKSAMDPRTGAGGVSRHLSAKDPRRSRKSRRKGRS